jgi:hypothetical protein
MRVKDYIHQIEKGYKWWQRYIGTTILWWEFDYENSYKHPIYDESPEALWKPPIVLPVMVVIRDEDRRVPREEGFYAISTAHLTFGTKMAADAGMTDPHDARLHLKDRFLWDDRYFEVRRFQISGRLKRFEVVVGVDGTALGDEELVNQPHFPPPLQ